MSILQGPQPGPGLPCAPSTRLLLSLRMAPPSDAGRELSASTAGLWSLRASSHQALPRLLRVVRPTGQGGGELTNKKAALSEPGEGKHRAHAGRSPGCYATWPSGRWSTSSGILGNISCLLSLKHASLNPFSMLLSNFMNKCTIFYNRKCYVHR